MCFFTIKIFKTEKSPLILVFFCAILHKKEETNCTKQSQGVNMKFTYNNFCSIDCNICDVLAFHSLWKEDIPYNYEAHGRTKYLIYYQLENERVYYRNKKLIFKLSKHDIVFLPHGSKYTSVIGESAGHTSGIGISFNICDNSGKLIESDEDIKILHHDANGHFYKIFKRILFSVLHPSTNTLRLKSDLFGMLDNFFSPETPKSEKNSEFESIADAINLIENSPEENHSNKELANLCFMSESSFLRKFKAYSGGISPLQYRNHIRMMRAEELISTSKTVDEIAVLLGFYDASHLCRIYKQITGHSLKKKL